MLKLPNGVAIKTDEYMPQGYPDGHPQVGKPIIVDLGNVLYTHPENIKLLEKMIDEWNAAIEQLRAEVERIRVSVAG